MAVCFKFNFSVYIIVNVIFRNCVCIDVYKNREIGKFQHVLINEEFVFIVGRNGIAKLSEKGLKEHRHIVMADIFIALKDNTSQTLLVCSSAEGQYSSCSKMTYNLDQLKKPISEYFIVSEGDPPVITESTLSEKSALTMASGSLMKFDGMSIGVYSIQMETLEQFPAEAYQMKFTDKAIMKLKFKASFTHDNFVYFLYNLYTKGNQFVRSKIGKMCSMRRKRFSGQVTSYEDMPLVCRHNNTDFTIIENGIVIHDTILVSFRNEMSSALCLFEVSELQQHFRASRANILRCNQQTIRRNEYFKPDISDIWNERTCIHAGNQTCFNPMMCAEIKGDFCKTAIYHTIEGDTVVTANSIYNRPGNVINNLANKGSVLFLGTNKGHVIKLNVSCFENVTELGTHIVDEEQNIVNIQMMNDMLYITTDNMVVRVSSNDGSFTNGGSVSRSWFTDITTLFFLYSLLSLSTIM